MDSTRILMYQDDMDPQLRREFLGDIDKEIDRLSSVVGDLLTLVHIDSHKLRLRREMMVLADTVRAVSYTHLSRRCSSPPRSRKMISRPRRRRLSSSFRAETLSLIHI